MTRYISTAARCAKAIREELKKEFPGTKFRVTCQNYSMGNNVNVYWTDGPAGKTVKSLLSKYEYGSFNPMEDIYEYSNTREDIPQTKFLFCNRSMTDGAKEAIAKKLNLDNFVPPLSDYDRNRMTNQEFYQSNY